MVFSEKTVRQKLEYGQLFLKKFFPRKMKIWMVVGREIGPKQVDFL